jgi:photosystem II stability/assembly factor-like uncharacterized protein
MPFSEDFTGNLYSALNSRIYKSTDNGISWNLFTDFSGTPFWYTGSLIFKPGGIIMFATNAGMFRSTNNGNTWSGINSGLPDPEIQSIAVRGDNIFTASPNSVSRSTDNGSTWSALSNGLPGTYARLVETGDNNSVFVYKQARGLYKSLDNGNTWTHVNSLPTNISISNINTYGDKVFVCSNDGVVVRSENYGDSWTDISSDLPDTIAVRGFTINPAGELYISIEKGSWFTPFKGIFRSTDFGDSWIEINSTISPAKLSVNSANNIFALTGTSLIMSTDGGSTFNQINTPEDNIVEYLIGTQDEIIAHSIEDKVYKILKSVNNGAAWQNVTGPLNNVLTYKLKLDRNARILAATQNGLYRSDFTTSVSANQTSMPQEFSLMQNYPNPFNPQTKITYGINSSLQTLSKVKLSVFDITGKEIKTLFEGYQRRGSYQLTFDGTGLPSGVYFYTLNADGNVQTRKMTMIK